MLEGSIGQPYMYQARHFISHGNLYEGWRKSFRSAGGGVLVDMGYHLLDVIIRIFGEVNSVSMSGSNMAKPGYSYEVEDAATLLIQHSSGTHGSFQLAALSGPKEESIEIRGVDGRMLVSKKEIAVFDVEGNLKNREEFEADGILANSKAFNQFLNNDVEIWGKNIVHNVELMKIFNGAYNKAQL